MLMLTKPRTQVSFIETMNFELTKVREGFFEHEHELDR